jgi:hypothetical protein
MVIYDFIHCFLLKLIFLFHFMHVCVKKGKNIDKYFGCICSLHNTISIHHMQYENYFLKMMFKQNIYDKVKK